MRFVRTILALLVAWSVAMAPTSGIAVAAVPTPQHARGADDSTAALAHAVHHETVQNVAGRCCDDDEHKPAHNMPGDCTAMPGCPLQTVSLAASPGALLKAPVTLSTRLVWHISRAIPPYPPAPLLRPPRS